MVCPPCFCLNVALGFNSEQARVAGNKIMNSPEKQSAFRSPWVLAWIGMLIVFVMANAVMIYLAADRPGLVVDDYYDRGQDYEKIMLKRMAKDLGWKMKVVKPKFADVGKPSEWKFSVMDKDGAPVKADSVTFYAYRPSDAKQDFSVEMELTAPGHYKADVTFPLLGVYDILVSVKKGEDEFNVPSRISAGVK
jgi:nitrogen fixation protein FixH